MKKSRLIFFFCLINFVAILIATINLPDMVVFKFDGKFNVSDLVGKWYNIILPGLALISSFIILMIDMREEGKVKHTYRYLISYIAIAVANLFSLVLLVIQFQQLNIGDEIMLPLTTLFFVPIAFVLFPVGYYVYHLSNNNPSIFSFVWTRENPVVWKKTHNFAGVSLIVIGILYIVFAILNDTIYYFNYMYIVFIGVFILLFYVSTIIYSKLCNRN